MEEFKLKLGDEEEDVDVVGKFDAVVVVGLELTPRRSFNTE